MNLYLVTTQDTDINNKPFDIYTLYTAAPDTLPEGATKVTITDDNFFRPETEDLDHTAIKEMTEKGISPILILGSKTLDVVISTSFTDEKNWRIETISVRMNKAQFPDGIDTLLAMISI